LKKLFLSNIIFLVLINLLIKPFYVFVIEVAVQNEVGHDQYGIFFSLFNFCYLFQIVTDLGLSNYNNVSIAKGEISAKENISGMLGLKLVLSLIFLTIIYLFSKLVDYPDHYYPLLWLIAFNQILVSGIIFFRSNISGLGYYKLDSILSVLDKVILIGLLSYLLWIYTSNDFQFSIEWFVKAQMISLLLTLLVAGFVSFSKLRLSTRFPKVNFSLIKKSLPFALIILTMSAYSRVDGVMLERILDDGGHESGIYAASYRILDALNIIGFLFAGLLLPMFSKLMRARQNIVPTLKLSFLLLLAIAIPVALYFSFYGEDVLMTMYPNYSNTYYTKILTILTWGFIGIATTHIFGTLLTANESLYKMNIILLMGLIINVVLNWAFIPMHKALAAAWTTFATEIFIGIGLVILGIRELNIKFDVRPIFRLLCFGILMFGIYYLLATVVTLNWLPAFFVGAIISFVVSLLLNIIDIRELIAVLTLNESI